MKTTTLVTGAILALALSGAAFAGGDRHRPETQRQGQHQTQGQHQGQGQDQAQRQRAEAKARAEAEARARANATANGGKAVARGGSSNSVAHGGRGGHGGQGGDSSSSSVAHGGRGGQGGSVAGSGNSTNTNSVSGAVSNDQTLSATVNDSGNSSVGDVSVDASSYHAAQRRNPVNSAFAPALVSGDDTCMGSTSAGAQGITFGISFGTTWKDDDCIIRKDARFLQNARHESVALSLMCQKESVRRAVELAGTVADKIACGILTVQEPTTVIGTPVATEIPSRDNDYPDGENG